MTRCEPIHFQHQGLADIEPLALLQVGVIVSSQLLEADQVSRHLVYLEELRDGLLHHFP